jgi:hypothetical protein
MKKMPGSSYSTRGSYALRTSTPKYIHSFGLGENRSEEKISYDPREREKEREREREREWRDALIQVKTPPVFSFASPAKPSEKGKSDHSIIEGRVRDAHSFSFVKRRHISLMGMQIITGCPNTKIKEPTTFNFCYAASPVGQLSFLFLQLSFVLRGSANADIALCPSC